MDISANLTKLKITMKRMTKERREYIAGMLESSNCEDRSCDEYIEELLEDAAFWREQILTFQEGLPTDSSSCCQFCHSYPPEHKPDCPWLLAQEGHDSQ